jgi:CRISPR/Cas system-associated endonuclease Cas1
LVVLKQPALKRFIAEFEARMQTSVQHPRAGGSHTYRRCLELQARALARVLRGETSEYLPFLTR